MKYERDAAVAHVVPTDVTPFPSKNQSQKAKIRVRQQVEKTETRFPYVANCGRDLAGEVLNYLYDDLKPRNKFASRNELKESGELIKFSQQEFIYSNQEESGLHSSGYLYIPPNCRADNQKLSDPHFKNSKRCKLHLILHGAMQNLDRVHDAFVEDTGYIEWASANDIVLLFPQAQDARKNPRAAWDFWGYSDPKGKRGNYCTKNGVQPRAIRAMVDRLMESGESKV